MPLSSPQTELPEPSSAHEGLPPAVVLPLLGANVFSSALCALDEPMRYLNQAHIPTAIALLFSLFLLVGMLWLGVGVYRTVLSRYQHDGGLLTLVREHLGRIPALAMAWLLIINQLLVVVSCLDAIQYYLPPVRPFVYLVLLVLVANNLFWFPLWSRSVSRGTYLALAGLVAMLIVVIAKHAPVGLHLSVLSVPHMPNEAWIILLLRTLIGASVVITGLESFTLGVSTLAPEQRAQASRLLVWVGGMVLGVVLLSAAYATTLPAYPNFSPLIAVLLQGEGTGYAWMPYLGQCLLITIFLAAANSALVVFPRLLGVLSHEGYLPRVFVREWPPLQHGPGLLTLAILVSLIWAWIRNPQWLLPLYQPCMALILLLAVGSLYRRARDWRQQLPWFIGLVIALALLSALVTNFASGGWLLCVIVPVGVGLCLWQKRLESVTQITWGDISGNSKNGHS